MEKKKINVSMLQMTSVIGDIEANCQKVKNLIEKYLDKSTDVLVLPEVWTVGWACQHFRKSAQDLNDSNVVRFLSSIAKNTILTLLVEVLLLLKTVNTTTLAP